MTPREKIAHLLRRFGFGATKAELDRLEPFGVEGTLNWLLDYEKADEGFPVSPWEFCFDPELPDVYLEPPRIASWWALRMLLTKRPLQEKLTLFWHDHFAVSAAKVEFGPAMLTYLDTLRQHATGDFATLLKAVSKEPAMIRWLDTDANTKIHPNENFAREVLELFTMGIGNYSERDVKESARAFTGWGNRYLVFEPGAEKIQQTARAAIERDEPMIAFCVTPSLHDTGTKTVLGQAGTFDGDAVLDMLAKRPETATYICKKLWEFFAYEKPEEAVVTRLSATFTSTGGNIKAVMRTIATSEEFFSDKCVRKLVKSPADFTVSIVRQFALDSIILGMRSKESKRTTPAPKPLRDASGLLLGTMFKQGMLLLYPPDVGGWDWGTAWITSTNMIERVRLADMLFGIGQPAKPLVPYMAGRVLNEFKPTTSAELADALITLFDAPLPPEKRKVVAQSCESNGGVPALKNIETASKLLGNAARLIFGSPEFQFM
jgi:hypothetical protein